LELGKKLGPCFFYFELMDVSQENEEGTGGRRGDWAENSSAGVKKNHFHKIFPNT
jgi:hypothetical protein